MANQTIEPRFIAVEGSIGAGKTSLVNLLGEQYGARVILEDNDTNPFIAKFYEDQEAYSFQTQIFFLLNRFNQYQELAQRDLFNSVVVIDYLFQRDKVFAQLNLEDHEYRLYEQIFNLIGPKAPKPDLVIFLQANTEVLLKRVSKRGRDYEAFMDPDYLDSVNKAFNNFFFYYSETPLLVINTNEIDFVEKKCDLEELINKINSHRIGREYYNPLGS
ncbi:MAG: deoxynucleoside kinase [Nitrospina sp.]|nr:deoxynucleoside kinase [Nitrospina sp.]MBT3415356.1 deoxynucleoside kinase [Nitrospina sp.]MBT4390528.1 deoxynucleoside kinase [Nitrospina sp.]MBT4620080.1 deoxynucleoside kinase [Nitrospina sp.]MBT5259547.1 deoxynucleoside kinase [Nitrospina sp.]